MGKEFQRGGGKPNFSRGRGGNRGGRGGRGGVGGMKAKAKAVIEPHRFKGIFIAKTQKEDCLVTFSYAPGEVVYGEKKIQVDDPKPKDPEQQAPKLEYRVWNAFRSKLAACIVNGVKNIYICPGAKVLYLGAASGTTVSHVSDIVGESGVVYAIEFSQRCGRDLTNMAKKRTNVIPIIEDARYPWRYRMMVGMCDVIFSDVAQPDQARIIALNAQYFLKNEGGFVFSIKANCVDSTLAPAVVFKSEIQRLKESKFKCKEQVTLEPFERDHCVVTGIYRPYESTQSG